MENERVPIQEGDYYNTEAIMDRFAADGLPAYVGNGAACWLQDVSGWKDLEGEALYAYFLNKYQETGRSYQVTEEGVTSAFEAMEDSLMDDAEEAIKYMSEGEDPVEFLANMHWQRAVVSRALDQRSKLIDALAKLAEQSRAINDYREDEELTEAVEEAQNLLQQIQDGAV